MSKDKQQAVILDVEKIKKERQRIYDRYYSVPDTHAAQYSMLIIDIEGGVVASGVC